LPFAVLVVTPLHCLNRSLRWYDSVVNIYCCYYHAVRCRTKRGIAIACRPSVCLWRWWTVIT